MAIGDDALEGLDLSVLQNITVNPDEDAKKDKEKDESPSIFEPQLKIQEVDEIPEDKKEEVKVEEVEPSEEVKEEIKDEPASETKTEDKEEPVSETTETSETEEETENAFRIFAEMQRDKGLIDFKDEEFEENDEWLLSKISDTIEYKVNEYKDTIPSEIKYLLDNYEAGVPLGDLINMQNK